MGHVFFNSKWQSVIDIVNVRRMTEPTRMIADHETSRSADEHNNPGSCTWRTNSNNYCVPRLANYDSDKGQPKTQMATGASVPRSVWEGGPEVTQVTWAAARASNGLPPIRPLTSASADLCLPPSVPARAWPKQ